MAVVPRPSFLQWRFHWRSISFFDSRLIVWKGTIQSTGSAFVRLWLTAYYF